MVIRRVTGDTFAIAFAWVSRSYPWSSEGEGKLNPPHNKTTTRGEYIFEGFHRKRQAGKKRKKKNLTKESGKSVVDRTRDEEQTMPGEGWETFYLEGEDPEMTCGAWPRAGKQFSEHNSRTISVG